MEEVTTSSEMTAEEWVSPTRVSLGQQANMAVENLISDSANGELPNMTVERNKNGNIQPKERANTYPLARQWTEAEICGLFQNKERNMALKVTGLQKTITSLEELRKLDNVAYYDRARQYHESISNMHKEMTNHIAAVENHMKVETVMLADMNKRIVELEEKELVATVEMDNVNTKIDVLENKWSGIVKKAVPIKVVAKKVGTDMVKQSEFVTPEVE